MVIKRKACGGFRKSKSLNVDLGEKLRWYFVKGGGLVKVSKKLKKQNEGEWGWVFGFCKGFVVFVWWGWEWGVKIDTLRSRLPIAMLYLGKFGSEAIF